MSPMVGILLLALGITPTLAQEGYRVLPDQVLVDRAADWKAWQTPPGVRFIDDNGTAEPRFLRRGINAALDASAFTYVQPLAGDTLTGGIRAAGTNPLAAPLIIDGDPSTYWEPDPQSPIDDWFAEIDLGRALVVQRIVVRFVPEGKGDPFLKFRVLLSDGLELGQEHQRRYFHVGLVNQPNKTQREFVFDVAPQRPVPERIGDEIAQFVRIDVLDTDGPRAEEVSAESYQQLPAEDQGAIDYFRLAPGSRQLAVSQTLYASLPTSEQGPIHHYRREHPRLAEVEVYALGDNVVGLTQREKKRDPAEGAFNFLIFRSFTDGLYTSWFSMPMWDPFDNKSQTEIDLGARYWLERVKLLSPTNPLLAYQVRIADGTLDPSGERIWTTFEPRRNPSGYQHLEEQFPLQEVRFIEVRRLEFSGTAEEEGNLSEIQAYGEGYVSEVAMKSPFIQLERPRLFSGVSWEGDAPPNTRIEVRTRSGDNLIQIPHYFASTGREISKQLWERISVSQRPPVQIEEVPGPEWSGWSEVYRESGAPFKSPSPRRMVQVEVRLLSHEPLQAARIRGLQLHFEAPLVDEVVGEIWPAWEVRPGEDQEFTIYLRPRFGIGNPGFDRMRLRSSSSAPLELLAVYAGSDNSLKAGTAPQLWPGRLQVKQGEEGGQELIFPAPVVRGETVYALQFRTRVFLQSTAFAVLLERQNQPGAVQAISQGDASQLVASQSLSVVSELQDIPLLDQVKVVPAVFTPNGDGVNDETEIKLSVFHLEGTKNLEVGIYSLNGQRVRDLSQLSQRPSGEHRIPWDGRSDHGVLLPPGIYVVRVGLAVDNRDRGVQTVRLVHLVY